MKESAITLFKKAENDLISAKVLFESGKTTSDVICFHCQQAVEKCLKAYLAYNNKEILKTHDISDILKDCEQIDTDFAKIGEIKADKLTYYAVNTRYDDIIEPTYDDAKEAISIAEQVRLFLINKIKELNNGK
ncbi:MAG: HEPN domain-containing protein [bacterium]